MVRSILLFFLLFAGSVAAAQDKPNIVLVFLEIGGLIAVVIAWFAILFTGTVPRGLFNYMVGVFRWSVRVEAYAFLLTTDRYPPFRLSE